MRVYIKYFIYYLIQQVVRSLVLPFTVTLSWTILKKPSSALILVSCFIIFIGFLQGTTFDALNYDSKGFIFGVISSLTTAAHAIIIKKSLDVVKGNTMALVYYNNVLSACMLFPWILLSGELAYVSDLFEPSLPGESTTFFQSDVFVFLCGCFITVIKNVEFISRDFSDF